MHTQTLLGAVFHDAGAAATVARSGAAAALAAT